MTILPVSAHKWLVTKDFKERSFQRNVNLQSWKCLLQDFNENLNVNKSVIQSK